MTQIHPTAIVSPGAQLGQDVEIGPFCTVGPQVQLGDGVRLVSHVVIEGATQIGAGTTVHPFAVLGGAPQHLAHKGEDTRLVIGERNIIREHVTMHAGTVGGGGVTKVGSDSLYMVGAHVAHDCIVGDRVTFAGMPEGSYAELRIVPAARVSRPGRARLDNRRGRLGRSLPPRSPVARGHRRPRDHGSGE